MATQKRLELPQEEFPLQPELVITDRDLWLQRFQIAAAEEERWMIATVGTGAGTLLLLSGRLELAQQSEGAVNCCHGLWVLPLVTVGISTFKLEIF